jgi:hypothetical protein
LSTDTSQPLDKTCQQGAFCGHEFLDEPNNNGLTLAENPKKLIMYEHKLRLMLKQIRITSTK